MMIIMTQISAHKLGSNKKRTQTAKELKALRLEEIKTLGLNLRADGLGYREIHVKIREANYKISYDKLFQLLKD